ncbi:MAG: dTDP-glucose 4,6-dehydratase [Solitalea-like symbiont of Tyrophagus putrescentiae]
MNLLVTGGCGFIGSHLIKQLLKKYPTYNIINFDKINYAVSQDVVSELNKYDRYTLIKGDIFDKNLVESVFEQYSIDSVIHIAAESSVDVSINSPIEFLNSNVAGTFNLLESFRLHSGYKTNNKARFYYVSTDEVYGALNSREEASFTEETKINPSNPYSASKAGGEAFCQAYGTTYGLPVLISRCTNNYGPYQHEEKLIPQIISNAINNLNIKVYDDGQSVREWLYVTDHTEAIDLIFHEGTVRSVYNVGSGTELSVLEIVNIVCNLVDKKLNREIGSSQKLIKHIINGRPGEDFRYSLNTAKIKKDLNWEPLIKFNDGIESTINWYFKKYKCLI